MEQITDDNTQGLPEYPMISIGIPTYNSYGKITKALRSIWHQDYPNIEVIVSDNCSTDNTEKICREFSDNFFPIRYYRQSTNIGLYPNFQFVLKQCHGSYFMWMCDDDQLQSDILSKYVRFLRNNPTYSLVSGEICYWAGDNRVFVEKDFTIEDDSPSLRIIKYYSRVVYGAMFFGLMRRDVAMKVPLRNCIGNDWHLVANLACLGKIKTLACLGYNKRLGGISRDYKYYTQVIKASKLSYALPRLQIALDAFAEILYKSNIFSSMPFYSRLGTACVSSLSILFKYYLLEFPLILGGKIKRLLISITESRKKQTALHSPINNQLGK